MAVTFLCIMALVLLIVLMCRLLGIWPHITAWIFSNKEEKASLTRLKGHYNANGYLVPSDSDIQLDATGSFRHFDSVDKDFPPQPLRPAPAGPLQPTTPPTSVTTGTRKEAILSTTMISTPMAITNTAGIIPITSQSASQEVASLVTEEEVPATSGVLQRAVSCDSVCSDTSVGVQDLQEPNVTGYLCVGLQYDNDTADLTISVLEAKDLICSDIRHPVGQPPDTYVRVYLQPDKTTNMQTRVYKKSNCPSYKEKFLVGVESTEWMQRIISFHVYSTDRTSSTLLGEVELKLADVSPRQPVTTWLTLTDTGQRETELGEVLFSLSYLPTAERLTVVMVKARNLSLFSQQSSDSFVKVYLLQHGKKVHKKRTSIKRGERSPIFNEAIIFSVPAHTLQTIHLRVTVTEVIHGETTTQSQSRNIGHVIIGSQSSGKALHHWTQMLTSLRKPIAMWHPLRTK